MKCSCVILNYNDSDTVKKFIEKINLYNNISHFVIVDNQSTDSSFEELTDLYKNSANIVVIQSDENKGYGYGNNFGVRYVAEHFNDEYVLITNPDVIFSEQMLDKLLESINQNKASVISAVQYTTDDTEIKDKAWKVPTAFEYIFCDTKLSKILNLSSLYPNNHFDTDISVVDCVPGAMLLVKISDFLAIGGYDERMFLYGEETTLGYKLKKAGYKSLLANKEKYIHIGSTSTSKVMASKVEQRRRIYDSRLFFLKNYLKVNSITYFVASAVYSRILRKISKL